MTTGSTFLSLTLLNNGSDLNYTFDTIRSALSGTSNSNMIKIDTGMRNVDKMIYEYQDSNGFLGAVTNSTPTTGMIQFGCAQLDGSGTITVTFPVSYPIGTYPTVIAWLETPNAIPEGEIYNVYMIDSHYDRAEFNVRKIKLTPSSITEASPTFSISVEEANVLPDPLNFYIHWMAILG